MKLYAVLSRHIDKSASGAIRLAGSNLALLVCCFLVLVWAVSGFFFSFSQRWESIIGTVSSVVTVLMVFLIQKTQNKDSLAIQLKLNELVAAHGSASNRLVNVEGMTEDELRVIQKYYTKLSEFARKQDTLTESHSIDEKHNEHAIRQELEQELKAISEKDEDLDEKDEKDEKEEQ